MTGRPANISPLTDEQAQARSRRNVAIALGLVAFAALMFVITLVQFTPPGAGGAGGAG